MPKQQYADMLAAMTAELTDGRTESVAECFRARDLPSPMVRFDPAPGTLGDTTLEILHAYWMRLRETKDRDGQDLPSHIDFDPLAISVTLPYVMLLDVIDGGADFRYRVYGREIAERFGRDLTGKLLSETSVQPHVAAFFVSVYRAAIARREAILTEHAPPSAVSVTSWRRLILPFTTGDGAVSRFVVGNIPGSWRAAADAPK